MRKKGNAVQLVRPDLYLGRDKAIRHVTHLAKTLKIAVPKPKAFAEDVFISNSTKTFRINFKEEIDHTCKHGRANMLQSWFDAEDRFLQPAIEMSASGTAPGIRFHLTSTLGRHSAQVSNHGALESPELALTRDICYFHKETCERYNARNLEGFSRSFRGFLHSAVSLVDCFLFRYAFHIRDIIPDSSKYINTITLDSRASVMERLEAWLMTFAPSELEPFKDWKERSQFMELKNKRNEFTHPAVPTVSFEPKDVAKHLNYGATGVGHLLGRLRRAGSVTDKIGFIHQVSHLPTVTAKG
jgi:hypothetical protein